MDVKLLSIDVIGLSGRSRNLLYRAGVRTVGDMLNWTEEELSQMRNLGAKSLAEILGKIDKYKKLDASGGSLEQEMPPVQWDDVPFGAVYSMRIEGKTQAFADAAEPHAAGTEPAVGAASDGAIGSPKAPGPSADFPEPEDFDAWLMEDENRQLAIDWLEEEKTGIEALELLSTRAYNLLAFSDYESLSQIAFLSESALMEIPRMDVKSAKEIVGLARRYIREKKGELFAFLASRQRGRETGEKAAAFPKTEGGTEEVSPEMAESAQKAADASGSGPSIFDLLTKPEYHDAVLTYVRANDRELGRADLSNRAKIRLAAGGYSFLGDIIFKTRAQLAAIPKTGEGILNEIGTLIHGYMEQNLARMQAVAAGNRTALWTDDMLRGKILALYQTIGFGGFSLDEMLDQLQLPEGITVERIKRMIGSLLAAGELEYVDFRCYRVYPKFKDYLGICTAVDGRNREIIAMRLEGHTLEETGAVFGMTRERVRQIVKRDMEKARNAHMVETGQEWFDEDYFRYFYGTYAVDKKDGSEWLGIPAYVWSYMEACDVKKGTKEISSALEDRKLDAGLRLKIKSYLNRNKIYVDGMWVEKKRSTLENLVVRKFCREEVSFDAFASLYNHFLEQEEIAFDEDIYLTPSVYRTRKNRMTDERYLLWKLNERFRYYDIDGRDYTEFLDTLNLDSYENIEISTEKLMNDYPEIMEKYDIRDQYELHNLLRKIIPDGSCHDFHCERMPIISFGVFDRNQAILNLIAENAPVTTEKLTELLYEEYGYNRQTSAATYLTPFSAYCHTGVYSVEQKRMSDVHRAILQAALTDDFYYTDEVRRIYARLVPGADLEAVNPYNLKRMGFLVFSKYVLQRHDSLDAYFRELLTAQEILDISPYRRRFMYVQAFSQTFGELKRSRQILEFEPNQIISMERLSRSGVTREAIEEFCSSAYDYVGDGEYFSAQSLRVSGFSSELYDLGFSDWFYANLLTSDERFSYGIMFGAIILYKGRMEHREITIKAFAVSCIQSYGSIDCYDLAREMADVYGCIFADERNVLYKVQDTEIYYDAILDRLYANADLYYKELDEGAV